MRLQCAWCHWQLGDGPRSEAIYSQVLEDDPVCWQALLDRARMYARPPPAPDTATQPETAAGRSAAVWPRVLASRVLPRAAAGPDLRC